MDCCVFEAIIDGRHIIGWSMMPDPAFTKAPTEVDGGRWKTKPRDWKNITQEDWHRGITEDFLKSNNLSGAAYAVATMPVLHLYVYDVELDAGDVRVFSVDKDIERWRSARRKAAQLGEGREEKFVKEVVIRSRMDALKQDIDDYRLLLLSCRQNGFFALVTQAVTGKHGMERAVFRKMQDSGIEDRFGIQLTGFELKDFTHERTTEEIVQAGQVPEAQANTNPIRAAIDKVLGRKQ